MKKNPQKEIHMTENLSIGLKFLMEVEKVPLVNIGMLSLFNLVDPKNFFFVQFYVSTADSTNSKLELTKHITPHALMAKLFSSGAPHIHFLPQFCNDSALCGLPTRR